MKILLLTLFPLLLSIVHAGETGQQPANPETQIAKNTGSLPSGWRIACVGDSITAGFGIKDPKNNSYPAQLQKLFTEQQQVKNFGVSGRTLTRNAGKSYWKTKAYSRALAWNPHVIIIKLGSNDANPANRQFLVDFKKDLKALILSFQSLAAKPLVYLGLPTPVIQTNWGIREKFMAEKIRPLIAQVAAELKLPVIDFFSAVPKKAECIPDGVHPNAAGARIMAGTVYQKLITDLKSRQR